MKRTLTAILAVASLSACGFVHDEQIDGPYRLVAVDTMEQMSVCYDRDGGSCNVRTPDTVWGYGFDERYIVAASSSRTHGVGAPQYWYIDRAQDRPFLSADDITEGPFTEEEFIRLRSELGLPPITRELERLKQDVGAT